MGEDHAGMLKTLRMDEYKSAQQVIKHHILASSNEPFSGGFPICLDVASPALQVSEDVAANWR
jgi:hypothetical protein